jgi:hypothetical protein
MDDIGRLRARLALEVGIARSRGRALVTGRGTSWGTTTCCLLGAVNRRTPELPGRNFVSEAARKLGISPGEASHLERSFEGFPYYGALSGRERAARALGAEFRAWALPLSAVWGSSWSS